MKKKKQKELLKKLMMITAGLLILIILIIILIILFNRPKTYTIENIHEFELRLIELAKEYYNNNANLLPTEGESTTLVFQSFVDLEIMKPLEEVIINGEGCSAKIDVTNNNGYLLFLPKVDCGDRYKYQVLTEIITDEENIVESGNGLYLMGENYVFRGDNVKNHIYFANRLWVILSVYEDGSMQIMEVGQRETSVWDNRFNVERRHSAGINDFIRRDINSRIKDRLDRIDANPEYLNPDERGHLLKQTLCIGKRTIRNASRDGRVECRTTLEDQTLGLIAVYEFLRVSLDPNCRTALSTSCVNYNYLARLTPAFWTLTGESGTTHRVFRVSGSMNLTHASNSTSIKVVARLTNEALYRSGDGSANNPYQLITSPITAEIQ